MIDAKKYLEEIAKDNAIIESKLAEIDQLKSYAEKINAATSGTPVQTFGESDRIGKIVADIVDKENELQVFVNKLIAKRNERIKLLGQLEDRLQYVVLYKRYMQSMKFEDIADEEHYSPVWISIVHKKALENIQNILNSIS